VDSLKIEESALLIGMLNSPTLYNPRLKPKNSLARRNIVIDNLADRNYIPQESADSLKKIPLQLQYNNAGMYGNIAPYFLVQIEELTNSILEKITKPMAWLKLMAFKLNKSVINQFHRYIVA